MLLLLLLFLLPNECQTGGSRTLSISLFILQHLFIFLEFLSREFKKIKEKKMSAQNLEAKSAKKEHTLFSLPCLYSKWCLFLDKVKIHTKQNKNEVV